MIYAESEDVVKREIDHIQEEIQQEQDWIDELNQSIEDMKGKKDPMGIRKFCKSRIDAGKARIRDLETDKSHLETLLQNNE